MATLTGNAIQSTYQSLLKYADNTIGGATNKEITDGVGNSTGLYLGTTGNIGIGTATPGAARLYIQGTGSTSATYGLRVANNSGVNNLTVLDNGNVGIRQSAPAARLHVQAGGATTSDNVFRLRNSADSLNLFNMYGTGQVSMGINSAVTSAMLAMVSTTLGFLMPVMTQAQILAIATPANGLQVYNTDLAQPCFYDGLGWRKVSHTNM
jgi:hypothetical protein